MLKRIIWLLAAVICLCSCGVAKKPNQTVKNTAMPVPAAVATKVPVTPAPTAVVTEVPITPSPVPTATPMPIVAIPEQGAMKEYSDMSSDGGYCICLWYAEPGNYYMPGIDIWEDMDADGIKENIKIDNIIKDSESRIAGNLTVGKYQVQLQCPVFYDSGWIAAIYLTDIIPNDNKKEIAIFSDGIDGMRNGLIMYSYGHDGLELMKFDVQEKYDENRSVKSNLTPGVVFVTMLDVHPNSTFTIRQETHSNGLWNVYVTYRINEEGNIELVPQDVYEVPICTWIESNEYGYFRVNAPLSGRGFDLYEGEWIRIVADTQENRVKLRKSTGEEGWITIYGQSDWTEVLSAVSYAFIVAD